MRGVWGNQMYSVVFKKGELAITGRLVTQTLNEKWTVHRRGQRFPFWSEQSLFFTENTLFFSKFCIAGKKKGREKCKQQSCWDSSGPPVRQVWQKPPDLGVSPGALWSCTVTHQQLPRKADIAFSRLFYIAVCSHNELCRLTGAYMRASCGLCWSFLKLGPPSYTYKYFQN